MVQTKAEEPGKETKKQPPERKGERESFEEVSHLQCVTGQQVKTEMMGLLSLAEWSSLALWVVLRMW